METSSMCGRYALSVDITKLSEEFPWVNWPSDIANSYNIAPTQSVLVIPNNKPYDPTLFHWGLIPSWAKDKSIANKLINARAETLAEKPSFRTAFRKRRCLIITSGYFEWFKQEDGTKIPVYISLKHRNMFAFAGLWEKWQPKGEKYPVYSCTIITCQAAESLSRYHHRMPVILQPDDYMRWLTPEEVLPENLQSMLKPSEEDFSVYPVSTQVNNPRNNSKENITRQGELFS